MKQRRPDDIKVRCPVCHSWFMPWRSEYRLPRHGWTGPKDRPRDTCPGSWKEGTK